MAAGGGAGGGAGAGAAMTLIKQVAYGIPKPKLNVLRPRVFCFRLQLRFAFPRTTDSTSLLVITDTVSSAGLAHRRTRIATGKLEGT
eukprot:1117874-Rhodomonas_salina.1